MANILISISYAILLSELSASMLALPVLAGSYKNDSRSNSVQEWEQRDDQEKKYKHSKSESDTPVERKRQSKPHSSSAAGKTNKQTAPNLNKENLNNRKQNSRVHSVQKPSPDGNEHLHKLPKGSQNRYSPEQRRLDKDFSNNKRPAPEVKNSVPRVDNRDLIKHRNRPHEGERPASGEQTRSGRKFELDRRTEISVKHAPYRPRYNLYKRHKYVYYRTPWYSTRYIAPIHYHYHPIGYRVRTIPDSYFHFFIGDLAYFYHGGVFYNTLSNGYVAVAAPLGAYINELTV